MTNTGIDYAAALHEAGFDEAGVAYGLRMLESRETFGDFEMVVSMLRIQGHQTGVGEHQLEPILQRIASEEAQAAIIARGERAAVHAAAARAERQDAGRAAARRSDEMSGQMSWLIENMTDDEIEERVAFRPEITEGWRRYLTLKAEDGGMSAEIQEQLHALDISNRLRLTRTDSGGGTGAVSEAAAGARGVNGL